MTTPQSENTEYTVEFVDGPLEGQTDTRVLLHGKHDERISMVAAVDSMESLFWYDEVDAREVQGKLHVRYAFDSSDSDPVESNDEPDRGSAL
ncbi:MULTISPECIES: hypothetical protein [Cryobacterium]|jgi:hypothetical protein|uniref:Uncharacterized protein n=1 Tax=Cryobacterium arcticum TaxID=670052 RepID=A0A1B1BKA5_9MICO|nr:MULTISPECIES: hypothetical protein [Cryobacterium]ANP72964.1 hypothetical protein PA27867_2012 [Cryobacterium arcticum]QYF75098.1 hypothetical protein KY500_08435 [Cryobacterium sp. PAMC25264]